MKKLKEFIPLWNLVKDEKFRIIVASICIFIVEMAGLLIGYLNGMAVEEITKNNLKMAIIYLLIYLSTSVVFSTFVYRLANSSLQKVESKVTRKLGYNTYAKALDLPAYAYEKTSSGEIINRINGDANTLSFAFLHILELVSSIIGSVIILVYVFFNSFIIAIEILVFMIMLFFVIKHYNPLLINIHKERKVHQDKHTTLINESIRGIREVKTLGIKGELKNNSSKINKDILEKSFKAMKIIIFQLVRFYVEKNK